MEATVSVLTLRWMTTTEIARRTGVSARYLREEIRNGNLHAMKFGTRGGRGTYRVPLVTGEAYVQRLLGQFYQAPEGRLAS
ncbi:DNA-binding protein [archaeon]|nr:MAG: DNA-binding protein [archaeon]